MKQKSITLNKVDRIEKIIHIGDIHIRQLDRHEEYVHIFNKLFDDIQKTKEKHPNTVVYIGGDIVHSKLDVSSEMFDMVLYLLKNIASITDVLILIGNHDLNVKNEERLDIITAISKHLNMDSIHILKYTGLYNASNITFSVMSVLDDPDNYIFYNENPDLFNNEKGVALFHGIVDGSANEYISLQNKKITAGMFNGFDFAMLGDVHKYQDLGSKNKLNTPIVYCSSLIQQNFGESPHNHGYVLWDVESNTYEFFEIPNEYSHFVVKIKDDDIKLPENITSKPYIKIEHQNSSKNNILELKKQLNEKVDVQQYKEVNLDREIISENKKNLNVEYGDVKSETQQQTLIKNYLYKVFPSKADNKTLQKLFDINHEVNNEVDYFEKNDIEWKPIYFEFSNMFSYGKNNYINFQNMNGLFGLFAPNRSGKSKFIDALSYCIFEKCSKTSEAIDVLNNKSDTFYCKLKFYINKTPFFIERKGNKQKRGTVSTTLDFYYIDENNNKISKNGQTKNETNKIIRSYLGTYENFEMTSLYSQKDARNFVYATQKDKKELFSDFLDINIFKYYYEISKNKLEVYKKEIQYHKQQDYTSQLKQNKDKIEDLNSSLKDLQPKYEETRKKKDSVIEENNKLYQQLKEIEETRNKETIQSDIKECNQKIERNKNKIKEINNQKESITINYQNINKKLEDYSESEEEIKENLNEFKKIEKKFRDATQKLKTAEQDYNYKVDKTKKLQQLEYDPNCSYCMNNIFVLDAIETKKILSKKKDELNKLKQEYEELEKLYEKYKKYEKIDQELNELKNKKQQIKNNALEIKNKEQKINNDTLKTENELNNLKIELEKFEKNKEIIEKNNQIKKEINKKESEYNEYKNILEDFESKISHIKTRISEYEGRNETINSNLEQFKELEEKYKFYELYNKIMHRDAIPLFLIKENLPIIEEVCNNILNKNFDINIKLELKENKIKSYIEYSDNNYWPLELISGMEEFVISIAVRIALIKISNIQKPNFFIIDEGFGTLDKESFSKMEDIFDIIKSGFDFVIVISHIEKMRDLVDKFIDMKIENNYSYIKSE